MWLFGKKNPKMAKFEPKTTYILADYCAFDEKKLLFQNANTSSLRKIYDFQKNMGLLQNQMCNWNFTCSKKSYHIFPFTAL